MKIFFHNPKPKIKTNLNRGFTIVEIIVAYCIFATAIVAATTVAQSSISASRRVAHNTQAAFLLEEGAEAARIVRDSGWSNISSLAANTDYYPVFSGGTWSLSTTASQVGIFTRKVDISNVNRDNTTSDISSSGTDDPGTKLITVTVSWTEGSQTVTKTLMFYLMDLFS